ncbi:MAG: hypothetical protein SFV53_03630 [Rickettsiales bacterium]|nr:hypothetical protein [Rickettsiales bacterium]
MPNSSVNVPPLSTRTADERQKDFDSLKSRISGLYSRKIQDRSKLIEKNLQEQFDKFNQTAGGADAEEFLRLTKEIFDEREIAIRHKKNTIRQLAEINAVNLVPQKAGVKSFVKQEENESTRINFNPAGTLEIKEHDSPRVYVTRPPESYYKQVFKANNEALDFADMNIARLENMMKNGRDLLDDEKEKLRTARSEDKITEFTKSGFSQSLAALRSITNYAGRGIWHQSNILDSNYARKYSLTKEALLQDLLNQKSLDVSSYSSVLRRIQEKIGSSNDLIDIASCETIEKLINDEIRSDDLAYQAQIKKMDEEIQKYHDTMLSDMQEKLNKDDELWKYRALSMFLILTPIGAFSIAGHVFSYIDPLTEIFGPLFGEGSIGEGMGKAVTSDAFGPFGTVMAGMKIDVAVQAIFDNTPILNSLCDTVNCITDSQIGQNLMVAGSPLLGSPLLLLGIAATYPITSAPEELKNSRETKQLEKKHSKILEDSLPKFYKEIKQNQETEAKRFVEKKFEIQKKANLDAKLAEFFENYLQDYSVKPIMLKFFGDQQLNGKNIFDLDVNGKNFTDLSAAEIIKFLNENESFKKQLTERFLLLAAIDSSLINKGEIDLAKAAGNQQIAEFDRLSDNSNDEIKKEKAKKIADCSKDFNDNFIINLGAGKYESYRNFSDGVERLENSLKSQEVNEIVEIASIDYARERKPNSFCTPKEARVLGYNGRVI